MNEDAGGCAFGSGTEPVNSKIWRKIPGVITDQCVDMAVRDAADRGYLVTIVNDACATYSDERHDAALRAYSGYCWTTDTDTVVRPLNGLRPG